MRTLEVYKKKIISLIQIDCLDPTLDMISFLAYNLTQTYILLAYIGQNWQIKEIRHKKMILAPCI